MQSRIHMGAVAVVAGSVFVHSVDRLSFVQCVLQRAVTGRHLRIVRGGRRAAMLWNKIRESTSVRQRDDCKRRSVADVEER